MPLPSDGPDYHADLAAWKERMLEKTSDGKHYGCYHRRVGGKHVSVGEHAAVWYNEFNQAVQCHACGFTFYGFGDVIPLGSLAE